MSEPPRNQARAERLAYLLSLCIEHYREPGWLRTYARAIEAEYGLRLDGVPPGPWRFGKSDPEIHLSTRGRRLTWAWMHGQWPILQEEFGLEYVGDSK